LKHINKRTALPKNERKQMALRVLRDTIDIVQMYEPILTRRSFASSLWPTIFYILSSESKHGFACDYNIDDIKKCISKGEAYLSLKSQTIFPLKTKRDIDEAVVAKCRKGKKNADSLATQEQMRRELFYNMFIRGGVLRNDESI